MDSDHSSSASLAVKICNCQCGRRMSSITHDFHSVCIECIGVDCIIDSWCIECSDIDNNT